MRGGRGGENVKNVKWKIVESANFDLARLFQHLFASTCLRIIW